MSECSQTFVRCSAFRTIAESLTTEFARTHESRFPAGEFAKGIVGLVDRLESTGELELDLCENRSFLYTQSDDRFCSYPGQRQARGCSDSTAKPTLRVRAIAEKLCSR